MLIGGMKQSQKLKSKARLIVGIFFDRLDRFWSMSTTQWKTEKQVQVDTDARALETETNLERGAFNI